MSFGNFSLSLQQSFRGCAEVYCLLAAHENCSDLFDCHPLIREYFGRQLREMQHDAWRQAHTLLYEYYKALPEKLYSKKFPDTLQEMQPLFLAVAHGCAAGFYQLVLSEIYISRIQRDHDNNYTCNILGAFSDDLATVAHFFTTPWHIPVSNLHVLSQAAVLNWAGFRLLALGRLREALRPMEASGEIYVNQRHWQFAAKSIYTFSKLQLALGNVEEAIGSGQRSIGYADQSGCLIERKCSRATLANALHQSGKPVLALTMFSEAEKLQQKQLPTYPYLYSVSGFEYCNLLLAQDRTEEARERAENDLDWWINHFKNGKNGGRLSFSLPKLTLGHVHLQQGDFLQASNWLEQAIDSLRTAGMEHYLPSGLLARAALYRNIRNPNHDITRARQDLQEVFDIAESSGMRLHLTDYHLEMVRLLIAEKEDSTQSPSGKDELTVQEHAVQAAKLIDETGYKRHLPELQELQSKINLLKYD
ncbi:MAG: hypothetical protein H0X02_03110 [Nitrosomonas sp.]|nr:hypothetical protein [Nitrosomonas sp.]